RGLGRQDPRARAEGGDAQARRHEPRDGAAAQRVVVEHLAQRVPLGPDRVEEAARAVGARRHHLRQRRDVARARRVAIEVLPHELPRVAPRSLRGRIEAIEHVGAVAPVAQQARLAQDREVPRYARLRHSEHIHQLLDRELLLLEQREHAHARRVRERLEDLLERLHACESYLTTGRVGVPVTFTWSFPSLAIATPCDRSEPCTAPLTVSSTSSESGAAANWGARPILPLAWPDASGELSSSLRMLAQPSPPRSISPVSFWNGIGSGRFGCVSIPSRASNSTSPSGPASRSVTSTSASARPFTRSGAPMRCCGSCSRST